VSFVCEQTSDNAIFLIPPVFGEFRCKVERAIVMDHVGFPRLNQEKLEWQQRLFDSYGNPNIGGWLVKFLFQLLIGRIE
jgi:hypothetical protein